MLRRDLVRKVGGYRAVYRHAEDYDLWLRLSQVTRMANLPDDLVSYRVYSGQVSTRHVVEQTRNAAIAWLAHHERVAGRADPVAGRTRAPELEELDALFGLGSAAYVRRRIVNRTLYSVEALTGDGWDALLGYIAEGGSDQRLWPRSLGVPSAARRTGRPRRQACNGDAAERGMNSLSVRAAAAWAIASQYTSFAVHFITSVVLARWFITPEELGLFSIAFAAITLVAFLLDFGATRYITGERDLTPQKVHSAFTLSVLFAWIIAVLALLAAGPIAAFYGDQRLEAITW